MYESFLIPSPSQLSVSIMIRIHKNVNMKVSHKSGVFLFLKNQRISLTVHESIFIALSYKRSHEIS